MATDCNELQRAETGRYAHCTLTQEPSGPLDGALEATGRPGALALCRISARNLSDVFDGD